MKRTAVILGGTKGLGKELSILHQRSGWQTIEIGSSAKNEAYDNTISMCCDLTSRQSVSELIASLVEIENIDRFYWVAGRMLRGHFDQHAVKEIEDTIDVNFGNAVRIVHHMYGALANATWPTKLIAIASSAGKKAKAGEAVYVATKHAQVGLIRSLGLENTSRNMAVSLFLPGGMQTSLWSQYPTDDFESFLDPSKVAEHIFDRVENSIGSFEEIDIPRGKA